MDENGLPRRPWYRHQIYAPGYNTEYNAIPRFGVREAIERKDTQEAEQMTNVHRKRLKSSARYFAVGDCPSARCAIAIALQVNKKTSVQH